MSVLKFLKWWWEKNRIYFSLTKKSVYLFLYGFAFLFLVCEPLYSQIPDDFNQNFLVDGYIYPVGSNHQNIYNSNNRNDLNDGECDVCHLHQDEYSTYPYELGFRQGEYLTEWYNAQDVGSFLEYKQGHHPGEDWNYGSGCADSGKEVYAIANGRVLRIIESYPDNLLNAGWTIVLEHYEEDKDVFYSVYTHVTTANNSTGNLCQTKEDFTFQEGQYINRGGIIARIAKGDNCGNCNCGVNNCNSLCDDPNSEDCIECLNCIDCSNSPNYCYSCRMNNTPTHLHFEIRNNNYNPANGLWNTTVNYGGYYEDLPTMLSAGVMEPSDFIDAYLYQENFSGISYFIKNNNQIIPANENNHWSAELYFNFLRETKVIEIEKECKEEKESLITNQNITNYRNCLEQHSDTLFLIEGFEDIEVNTVDIDMVLNMEVKRKEMAKLITLIAIKARKICTLDESTTNGTFNDVPSSHDYFKYIQTLKNLGVVSGVNNSDYFQPEALVNRAEMSKFIVEALCLNQNPEVEEDRLLGGEPDDITDVPENVWYYTYVKTLLNTQVDLPIIEGENTDTYFPQRIISGYEIDHTFRPSNTVTRAQIAKFIRNGYIAALNQNDLCNYCETPAGKGSTTGTNLKTNTTNTYSYLGFNYEQESSINNNPPTELVLGNGSNTINLTPSQNLVLSYPSSYDNDGDKLFFYWVADKGNLIANSNDYRSVILETGNLTTPTTINLFTLSGDNNGNISKGTFTINVNPPNASIEMTYPSNGVTWLSGQSYNIYWNSNNLPNDATISLGLFKSGNLVQFIANGISDNAPFNFDVPYGITPGNDYHIRGYAYQNGSIISEDNTEVFTINTGPPPGYVDMSLTETNYVRGQNKAIEWEDNIVEYIKIQLFSISGSLITTIDSSDPSDGYYFWSVPTSISAGNYILRITSTNNSSVYDEKYVSILNPTTNYPPQVNITSHYNGQIVTTDEINLVGTAYDDVDTYQTQVANNSGTFYSATMNSNDTWYKNGVDLDPGWNTIQVKAKDYYGLWSSTVQINVFYLKEVSSLYVEDNQTDFIPIEIYHDNQPYFRLYRSEVDDFSTAIPITGYFPKTTANSDNWKVYYDDYTAEQGKFYYYWCAASIDQIGTTVTPPTDWSSSGHLLPYITSVNVSSNDICQGESVLLSANSPLDYTTGANYNWSVDGVSYTGNPITLVPTTPISSIQVYACPINPQVGCAAWAYPNNSQITINNCSNDPPPDGGSGNGCIPIINVTQNVLNNQTDFEEASDELFASNEISSGGTAEYTAENKITLSNGFRANTGSTVHLHIQPCQNTSAKSDNSEEEESDSSILIEIIESEISSINELTLFPNPARNEFNIRFYLNREEEVNINLVDLSGKVWAQNNFKGVKGLNQFIFDSSAPPSGTYIVQIQTQSDIKTEKIILSH